MPEAERAAVMRELAALPVDSLASLDRAKAEHEVEAALARLRERDDVPAIASAIAASRASALAMWQTRHVAARLAECGVATTILNVTTTGDRVQDRAIAAIGSENVWVKELEVALRDRRADYAVHSCKDLPSQLEPDMLLAAVSQREDPRDAFCSERYASFADLPPGAIVGTSSLRRRVQLQALRPDLRYEDVRGNIDTRLRKMRDGRYDAIVLAMAGLRRLGIGATHTVAFDLTDMVPAVAQGALAVETRVGDVDLAQRLRTAVNDEPTEWCIAAERAAMRALRAGCNAPLGVHARYEGATMFVDAAFGLDSGEVIRERATGDVASIADAEALGERIAAALSNRRNETTA
jgi:hydroxymethylbilane synthase